MRLITAIRTIRATYEVEPQAPHRRDGRGAARDRELLLGARGAHPFAWGASRISTSPPRREGEGHDRQPVGRLELRIPMAGLFDSPPRRRASPRRAGKIDDELEGLRKKLENPQFVERAKPEVVAECRQREGELVAREAKIAATLEDLGAETGA